MTVIELLQLIEKNSFILYYYGFSMLLSVMLGRFFLSKIGQQGIWNYFFSLLIYVMSVFGIFSIIVFIYQIFTNHLSISPVEILIPFFTMAIGILLIRRRVNVSLLTGFGNFWTFFLILSVILVACFLLDYGGWWSLSRWPLYLFLLFLIAVTLVVLQAVRRFFVRRNIFNNI